MPTPYKVLSRPSELTPPTAPEGSGSIPAPGSAWVVCAANRHRVTGEIICGARHFDSVMRGQMEVSGGFPFWNNCDQGFIDQRGNFLTRKEAHAIAKANGQIRRRCGGDESTLFSENLY